MSRYAEIAWKFQIIIISGKSMHFDVHYCIESGTSMEKIDDTVKLKTMIFLKDDVCH